MILKCGLVLAFLVLVYGIIRKNITIEEIRELDELIKSEILITLEKLLPRDDSELVLSDPDEIEEFKNRFITSVFTGIEKRYDRNIIRYSMIVKNKDIIKEILLYLLYMNMISINLKIVSDKKIEKHYDVTKYTLTNIKYTDITMKDCKYIESYYDERYGKNMFYTFNIDIIDKYNLSYKQTISLELYYK